MRKKIQHISRLEFEYVLKQGRRYHTTNTTLILAPKPTSKDDGAGVLQYAVVVSKKVAKQAVVRNLIRRRLYAVIATCTTTHPPVGYVVVFAKPNILHTPHHLLQEEICSVLSNNVTQTRRGSSG